MRAGGWLMWPIAGLFRGRDRHRHRARLDPAPRRIMPAGLVARIWQLHARARLTAERIEEIRQGSPLGRMLAAGLVNRNHSREVMKEAITDAGRHVVADLERYLNALGTIAAVSPLLGLLGTVFGMIEIFSVIMNAGDGNAGLARRRHLRGPDHDRRRALRGHPGPACSTAISTAGWTGWPSTWRSRPCVWWRSSRASAKRGGGSWHESAPQRRRQPVEINLAPLIDVVFLLLIFFMVSTTFKDEARLRVQLPQAQGEEIAGEEPRA